MSFFDIWTNLFALGLVTMFYNYKDIFTPITRLVTLVWLLICQVIVQDHRSTYLFIYTIS